MNKQVYVIILFLTCRICNAQTPNWIWATGDGGIKTDYGTSIVTDNSGNSYVTGYFDSVTTFGNTVLTSNGSYDIFIAKYDSSGNLIWAESAGSVTWWDQGHGIDLDEKGHIYVTGFFYDTATFSGVTLISNGGFDCFLAKYDTSGNVIWVQKAGGTGWDEGNDLSLDSLGNCYLTGRFADSATFGNITITGITGPSSNYMNVFVAKYDAAGNVIWVQTAQGTDAAIIGQGISTDINGNSYITGWFADTVLFGSFVLASAVPQYDQVFIAKYDSSGNIIWARQSGGDYISWGLGISIDANGNCYVVGKFHGTATFGNDTIITAGSSDIFLAKYDFLGNESWVQRAGGTDSDYGFGITSDDSGNSYITGYFRGTATFGAYSLSVIGINNLFVAKYDVYGTLIWVQQATGDVYGHGTSLDGNGNCYVAGDFGIYANFGTNNLVDNGAGDFFIAKLDTNGTTSIPLIISNKEEIQIEPNPFKDEINIKVSTNELSEIILYDVALHKLLQFKFKNSVSLNAKQLAKGIYLYEVRDKNGLCKKGKVVKD